MRALIASVAILALAMTAWAEDAKTDSGKGPQTAVLRRLPPLDPSKLESAYSRDWNNWNIKEFADEKRGISIRVVERKRDEPFQGWRNEKKEIVKESGVAWLKEVWSTPRHDVTIRFPYDADTIRYLIKTPEAPLAARYVALGHVLEVGGLSKDERLELIELASRDARAAMRDAAVGLAANAVMCSQAVSMAGDYVPVSDAVQILCRALRDPCAWIAYFACPALTHYFSPADYLAGSGHIIIAGDEHEIDRALRRDVHIVARKVHGVRPDLVTEEDLAAIAAMYKPYDEDREGAPQEKGENASESAPRAEPEQKPDSKKNSQPAPK